MLKIDMEEMDRRAGVLETARDNIKSHFVGIDEMIDMIFSNLEVWYYMPELLTTPTIINLWGMTGVGKTDLVRRLVREIGMEENYAEVQLNNKPKGWNNSIQDIIEDRGIQSNCRGVLLLDEIQRFRSIDETGRMIHEYAFDDIWALLSDGKFTDSMREKNRLYMMLVDFLYDKDCEESCEEENCKDDEEENKKEKEIKTKKRKFQSSIYQARRFKRILEIEDTLPEIMTWTMDKKIAAVEEKISRIEKTKTTKSYSQLLIFICGNLDEAYDMSHDTAEANIDADILHEFSKRISILDIKKCLLRKFKPEQIARFGNNHVIYPSLSKQSFETIIANKVANIQERTANSFDIEVEFTENIYRAIYRNGVYPAQGVRPVLSTVNSIIENSLPFFLFNSVIMGSEDIIVDINEKDSILFARIGDKEFSRKIDLQLDKLKSKILKDEIALVSVHEAGHAVAYSLLFGLAPAQIISNNYSGGFTIPHDMVNNDDNTLRAIKVLLAGTVAEEIAFGKQYRSSGAWSDLQNATYKAAEYIRSHGFGKYPGTIAPEKRGEEYVLTKIYDTNDEVLDILLTEKEEIHELLLEKIILLKRVSSKIMEMKRVMPEEFCDIVREFIPDIKIGENNYKVVDNYNEMARKFIES